MSLQHPLEGFSDLLQRLRKVRHEIQTHNRDSADEHEHKTCYIQKSPFFNDIVHLYEPASHQSFFVNASLLVRRMAVNRCHGLHEGISPSIADLNTSFILLGLDGSPALVSILSTSDSLHQIPVCPSFPVHLMMCQRSYATWIPSSQRDLLSHCRSLSQVCYRRQRSPWPPFFSNILLHMSPPRMTKQLS
jgi:hypothetical protein